MYFLAIWLIYLMEFYKQATSKICGQKVYKKNDQCDVENSRGIALDSCFSKIFTGILNNRISINWVESNTILSDS